jgi:hypothetical protein
MGASVVVAGEMALGRLRVGSMAHA